MTRSHKPTRLADVARRARVSSATVSRVLNEPSLVSGQVRERVFHAIEELKWIPNGAAKALASARSRTVGILIPTLGHQNFGVLIDALQRDLGKAHYTLLLGCFGTSVELRLEQTRKMVERGIECLVLIGEAHPPMLFELLKAYRVPHVVTYTTGREPGNVCIGFDNYSAAVDLTEHLLNLGHCDFGMIAHMAEGNDRILQRIAGAKDTLARAGIAIRPQHFAHVDSRYVGSGREGFRRIFSDRRERPTALICTNDYIATGAMIEAKAQRIAVPGMLSIVGIDDTELSEHLDPPLTTIHIPSREMGEAVAKYIIEYLGTGSSTPPPPLEAKLIVRNSTAAVPKLRTGGDRKATELP